MRRFAKTLAALSAISIVAAIGAGSAFAAPEPGVQEFEIRPTTTQAGGHPDVAVHFNINIRAESESFTCETECLAPRIFNVHFPTGFIGDPHVVPTCSLNEFGQKACPSDSQVGVVDIGGAIEPLGELHYIVPVYNMETRPDQAGLVAFQVVLLGFPVFLELSGRTDSDYGLDSVSSVLFQPLPIGRNHLYLWGVPANASHDYLRFASPLKGVGLCFEGGVPASPDGEFPNCIELEPGQQGAKSNIEERAYLQNPSVCGVQLESSINVEYWKKEVVEAGDDYPEMTGCDQLGFDPSQVTKPTTKAADTASGVDVDLKIPQAHSATTPSQSELRTTITKLPEGFSINPNAADGKVACSDGLTGIGTLFAAQCPEFAKVGTVDLDVAALPAPIPGALYLGEPKPGDPYRLVLTADGFATHVKLPGSVDADPQTGRLTISFEDLPQQPLQEINAHFFGSERGLLATPEQCGTYEVENELIPWNTALLPRQSKSLITIDSGPNGTPCPGGPRPFAPDLQAGTENGTAGIHSPFGLSINREDGEQNLDGLTVKTPPGFSATLKGIPYCPESAIDTLGQDGYSGQAELAQPSCPVASQIGSSVAGVGAGSHPLYTGGKVYLAGPYKGAPLSLEVVVPAVSGPYDLGVVAVRAALFVDPVTAQVTAVSDPLPRIFAGIPLRIRYIEVGLDRPDFTLNPTNCDPSSVATDISGDEGAAAHPSVHFQVSNCAALPYRPKLALTLSGGVKRRGHPAIHAVLRAQPGEANSRVVSVTLPDGELLDNSHFRTICTKADFAAESCPAGSAIGKAVAETPLLDQPLVGTVYLRASKEGLPDIAIDFKGQIDFELSARVDSVNGRLRTTFETLPDAPVGTVTLDLQGGKKGLIQNSAGLCGAKKKAAVRMIGQNGVGGKSQTKLRIKCGAKGKKTRAKNRAAGGGR